MTITRDAADVWNEVCQKAEKHRVNGEPIYTLTRRVPNRIIEVKIDRIVRQSSESDATSIVSRREVEQIWDALCQHGQAVRGEVRALQFAWALVANLIDGLEFRTDPFRLVVVNEELANRPYCRRQMLST